MGCHVCGSLKHKRRDCPSRDEAPKKIKRGAATGQGEHQLPPKKRKRRKGSSYPSSEET